GLARRLADCFGDQRDPIFVEHTVGELLAQRIYGAGLGYEDINDHEQLRHDPLLATACGKKDPLGEDRIFHPDPALTGPSTLNRLELSNNKNSRCHKLPHDPKKIEALLVEMGARCLPKHAVEIVIDLDTMSHRLHGLQEGKHFNTYYRDYCYLPLYIFVKDMPLWAQLRTSELDPISGIVEALQKVVGALRRRCPKAQLIVRADSNFCREQLMSWCEGQREVYYCLGFARNVALIKRLEPPVVEARRAPCLSGGQVPRFASFDYQTCYSWSRTRRVVGKAEVNAAVEDTRFVVSNLPEEGFRKEADRDRFRAQRL